MKCVCRKPYDTMIGKFFQGKIYSLDKADTFLFIVSIQENRRWWMGDKEFDEFFYILDDWEDEEWEDISDDITL